MQNTPSHNAVTKPQILNFNYLATRRFSRSSSSSINPKKILGDNRAAEALRPASDERQSFLSTSFFTVTTVTKNNKTPQQTLKTNHLLLVTAPIQNPKNRRFSHKPSQRCHKLSQAAVTAGKQQIRIKNPKHYDGPGKFCNSVTAASDEKILIHKNMKKENDEWENLMQPPRFDPMNFIIGTSTVGLLILGIIKLLQIIF